MKTEEASNIWVKSTPNTPAGSSTPEVNHITAGAFPQPLSEHDFSVHATQSRSEPEGSKTWQTRYRANTGAGSIRPLNPSLVSDISTRLDSNTSLTPSATPNLNPFHALNKLVDTPKSIGPCYVENVPPGKILVVGVMKAGKSTLINRLLGAEVAKSGTGNRTTVARAKYRLPGCDVTFVDSMGIEVKDTQGTLTRSVKYVERCSHRLDPARHVCAGMICINGAAMQYQDIDIDIVKTFQEAKVPLIVVITQAFRKGVRELSEEIENHPVFQDVPVIPVNSENAYSAHGDLIETSFGLPELAEFLQLAVNAGRERAKPNALDEIQKVEKGVSYAMHRFQNEETRRKQFQTDQLTLNQFRLKNKSTHPLLDKVAIAIDAIYHNDSQLNELFAQLQQRVKQIYDAVTQDSSGVGQLEGEIHEMMSQIQQQEHEIRQQQIIMWTNVHEIRKVIVQQKPSNAMKGSEIFQQKIVELEFNDPQIISAAVIPPELVEEHHIVKNLNSTLQKVIAEKQQLIEQIEQLEYTPIHIQEIWEAGGSLHELEVRNIELIPLLSQLRDNENTIAIAFTEREKAIVSRQRIRQELKEIERQLSLNCPQNEVKKLLSRVWQNQQDAENAQLSQFEQQKLIQDSSEKNRELVVKIHVEEQAMIEHEKHLYQVHNKLEAKQIKAQEYLQKITEISGKLQSHQQEMTDFEHTVQQRMITMSKEAQQKFENALQKKQEETNKQMMALQDRIQQLTTSQEMARKAFEEKHAVELQFQQEKAERQIAEERLRLQQQKAKEAQDAAAEKSRREKEKFARQLRAATADAEKLRLEKEAAEREKTRVKEAQESVERQRHLEKEAAGREIQRVKEAQECVERQRRAENEAAEREMKRLKESQEAAEKKRHVEMEAAERERMKVKEAQEAAERQRRVETQRKDAEIARLRQQQHEEAERGLVSKVWSHFFG
jgi:hypothetical protein